LLGSRLLRLAREFGHRPKRDLLDGVKRVLVRLVSLAL